MKIERIEIGEDHRCEMEESKWNTETETYERVPHSGIGYKVGYSTFCEDCLKAMSEGIKILETNKKVKAIEI